jgi:hypothetical protein
MNTTTIDAKFCAFCGHAAHPEGVRCTLCRCKGKPGFLRNLGNQLGEFLFGGNR